MELSSTLSVSVKQGYSSYLKLLREKNGKSWWINLSRNFFEKMFEMKEDMIKWMQNGEAKECFQLGTVTLSVKLFEGEYYMCFEKKNGDYVNRINLNGTEWVNFHKMFVKIMGEMDPKLEAFEKPTLFRYFPKYGEKVYYFHEAAALVDFSEAKILKKKLPTPSKYEFALMGMSYLIKANLRHYLTKNCEGCISQYMSQSDHNLCLLEWGDQVDGYFHRIKSSLNVKDVVEFFGKFLKVLGLETDGVYEKTLDLSEEDLMDLVRPVKFPREYELLFQPFVTFD